MKHLAAFRKADKGKKAPPNPIAARRMPVSLVLVPLATACLPHIAILPPWVGLWCAGLWTLAWRRDRKRQALMRTAVRLLITLIGIFGVLVTFHAGIYSDAYLALLAVMSGIKPLEIRGYRDRVILLVLSWFLVITALLFSDELLMTAYMFFSVGLTAAALIRLHHPDGRLGEQIRLAGKIMLQSLPLMLILFYLFPRIEGNIPGFGSGRRGTSGFSDRMSPGGFSRMARNDEPAFRVRFKGRVPPHSDRYWRGIVLSRFDGRTWTPQGSFAALDHPRIQAPAVYEYEITLEPHYRKWLFALEMPAGTPGGILHLADHTLRSRHRITERVQYRLISVPRLPPSPFSEKNRARNLELPAYNKKARDLAASWRAAARHPQDIVNAALSFFQNEAFFYTLKPPALRLHSVDDFLFRTRKGYCEHYASAFVFLMRAAGVPARVVGGYQGGEINPYADYMTVRQSMAHAWAEVWLEEAGWIRVDPTAAVAPERIESGLPEALSEMERLELPGMGLMSRWLSWLTLRWDVINSYWILWVVGYSTRDQDGLLEWLGLDPSAPESIIKSVLLAAGIIGLIGCLYSLALFRRRPSDDPVRRSFDLFRRKLAAAGLEIPASAGPLDLLGRVRDRRPDLISTAEPLLALYMDLRYGRKAGNRTAMKDLARLARKFNARRALFGLFDRKAGTAPEEFSGKNRPETGGTGGNAPGDM